MERGATQLPSDLFISLAGQFNIRLEQIHCVLERCNVDYSPLSQHMYADFFGAGANHGRWLPIAWLKAALNGIKFKAGGSASFIWEVAKILQSRPDLGYTVKGFVDSDDRSKEVEKAGYALLANFEGFPEFLRHNVVDEVVIALPMKSSYEQAARIAALCEEQGVITRFLTDLFNTKIGKARAERIGEQAVTTITTGGMEGLARALKRSIDVLVASVALIVHSALAFFPDGNRAH